MRKDILFGLAATVVALTPAAASASDITVETVRVGAAGNAPVGIVPFKDAAYESCADVGDCHEVGAVDDHYGIGELEVTVGQWVAFLNTADPAGTGHHDLYHESESASAWPKYGSIDFSPDAAEGEHYSVASPEWEDKPYGFADFLRAARFVNSLTNGRVLSERTSWDNGIKHVIYRVRLSRETERGMYDLTDRRATRAKTSGFVIPSQDEWIKAAYYDKRSGSYWKYPTNPGVFGDGSATAPSATTLDPATGAVTNAAIQPLATYNAPAPTWCPVEDCASVNPFGIDPATYAKLYQGNLSTAGQALTRSPWGTLDQGGNAVEWTDTITPPPSGMTRPRVWRRLHGGVTNAPAYQMWPSAIGLQPQDNEFFERTYPWLGIRVGVIGDLG